MATKKKKKSKNPSASTLNRNLLKKLALEKMVEHKRDYLKLDITLPLGNKSLKKVHTNQWLWTELPSEFDLANWTILAKALNSNTNRYQGYVKNRWYIESNDITVNANGKAEMKLGLNAFASSLSSYSKEFRDLSKAYTDATTKKTTTTSASKKTTNAISSGDLIKQDWVKKYSIPSIIVDKIKSICKESNTEEANVRAWHQWMDAHVQWQDYNDSKKSMQQIINDGKGNCCDNSRMFRYGCLALGVKCRYMKGTSCYQNGHYASGHQWNIVYFKSGKKVVVDNGRDSASWGSHWGGCSSTWETDESW